MSFSLALAGSVMLTVSVISILPECLQDPNVTNGSFRLMNVSSWEFLHRAVSFGVGCAVYFGLSSFVFPDPDQVFLGLEAASDENAKIMEDDDPKMIQERLLHDLHGDKFSPIMAVGRQIRGRQSFRTDSDDEQSLASLVKRGERQALSRQSLRAESGDEQAESLSHVFLPGSMMQSGHQDYYSAKEEKTRSWTRWSSGADLDKTQRRSWRVTILLFVSLLAHNFPEGLAVAASALESAKLGITVMIGIMIHNIPKELRSLFHV
jgi:ZIP family zinc transporter